MRGGVSVDSRDVVLMPGTIPPGAQSVDYLRGSAITSRVMARLESPSRCGFTR
jgi:hypothetical protein